MSWVNSFACVTENDVNDIVLQAGRKANFAPLREFHGIIQKVYKESNQIINVTTHIKIILNLSCKAQPFRFYKGMQRIRNIFHERRKIDRFKGKCFFSISTSKMQQV